MWVTAASADFDACDAALARSGRLRLVHGLDPIENLADAALTDTSEHLRWSSIKMTKRQPSDGAPEEIRTPDPQIRSLGQPIDPTDFYCKPNTKSGIMHQWVGRSFANQPSV